jgi:hypothetical protein
MPLFQVLSDLHLEFVARPRVRARLAAACPNVSALVLAGDIAVGPAATDFIYLCLRNQPERKILYVLGNHEFYGHDHDVVRNFWRAEAENIPGLFLLDNTSVIIDGVNVLGSTLWSDMSDVPTDEQEIVRRTINDYKRITYGQSLITPADTTSLHRGALEWLESAVASHAELHGPAVPILVITHYLPSHVCIAPKYAHSPFACAFASDLDAFIESTPLIHTWVHGHSHSAVDLSIGTTRVVSNPLGYRGENPQHDPRCTVYIDADEGTSTK